MQQLLTEEEINSLAIAEAEKSVAKKRKVGAVIVFQDSVTLRYYVLATGYNKDKAGESVACEDNDGVTKNTVEHAEIVALSKLSTSHPNVPKVTMFITEEPCDDCKAALADAGVPYKVVKKFMKFDSAKLRYELVPPSAIKHLAAVLTYGARKYKANNWKQCDDTDRYFGAAMRHFEAYRSGEKVDPETGLSHLAHAMTNLAFLLEFEVNENIVSGDWANCNINLPYPKKED